ncbi:iron ABC transporter [Escherichia coli]|uniref:Iron ABC transporter n=1 Tax=Escherichia coli TaxID=562 RepID=A0A377K699_ECOLX|nr:iron ABC transporter [Escherichia coli]
MPTSGVVLFGIALVFTFNALVSIMQFVADEDTLQGLVFWDDGQPGSRIMGETGGAGGGDGDCFTLVRCVVPGSLPRYASAKSGR